MISSIKSAAAEKARRAGLLSGGLLFILIGAGFLTASAWIILEDLHGALIATTIVGAVYSGIGLILIGFSRSPSVPESASAQPVKPAEAAEAPPLMQAFLYGMQAGANADRRR